MNGRKRDIMKMVLLLYNPFTILRHYLSLLEPERKIKNSNYITYREKFQAFFGYHYCFVGAIRLLYMYGVDGNLSLRVRPSYLLHVTVGGQLGKIRHGVYLDNWVSSFGSGSLLFPLFPPKLRVGRGLEEVVPPGEEAAWSSRVKVSRRVPALPICPPDGPFRPTGHLNELSKNDAEKTGASFRPRKHFE